VGRGVIMVKIQIVCDQCGHSVEFYSGPDEEAYYNNFGYLDETNPMIINLAIEKIIYDFEHKPVQIFEFI